jgi:hypothetical protein
MPTAAAPAALCTQAAPAAPLAAAEACLAPSLTAEGRAQRLEVVLEAAALGADATALCRIAAALRISRRETVVLPLHRYARLSRGRGWARLGRGHQVTWGAREPGPDGGYRVGPGRWTVGGSDGYARKGEDEWTVEHVAVGSETWTVAS